MANSLERSLALISSIETGQAGDHREIFDIMKRFEGSSSVKLSVFSADEINRLDSRAYDGILLNEVSIDSADIAKTLREFHGDSKPIGAIGVSVQILLSVFRDLSLEVAGRNDGKTTRAIFSNCAPDDYVSDRENKILTTLGSLSIGATAEQLALARSRLLREFIEMA